MPDYEKINEAIRDCLQKCSQSEQPLDALAEELGAVTASRNWTQEEVSIVKKTVLRLLNHLVDRGVDGSPAA